MDRAGEGVRDATDTDGAPAAGARTCRDGTGTGPASAGAVRVWLSPLGAPRARPSPALAGDRSTALRDRGTTWMRPRRNGSVRAVVTSTVRARLHRRSGVLSRH